MKKEFIEAGEIVNTHGVAGEVKIKTYTDTPELLGEAGTLYIEGKPYRVLSSRVHKDMLLARLEGVGDVNAAMTLKGRRVFFHRADLPEPEGGYYAADLVGCRCVTESGEDIGVLTEALEYPASLVYVINGESEHLVPARPEFILNVDDEASTITVRLLEGM